MIETRKETKELQQKMFSNEFFALLDKIARYDGEDILFEHDRYNLKNFGVSSLTDFKVIEVQITSQCVPFEGVVIGVNEKPRLSEWWEQGKEYKQYLKGDEGEFFVNTNDFFSEIGLVSIQLDLGNGKYTENLLNYTSSGWWLDTGNQCIDRFVVYDYIVNCLQVFNETLYNQ